MIQVRRFFNNTLSDMNKSATFFCNKWLQENPDIKVIDIKYAITSVENYNCSYQEAILVIYETAEK